MIAILADHNIEGQAIALWETLNAGGWLELSPLRLVTFAQAGLPPESSDRAVWRFAQEHNMMLLTSNRRMRDADALEQTIREENTVTSLPVLTIGNGKRMIEKSYRERCAARLLEIVLDLETIWERVESLSRNFTAVANLDRLGARQCPTHSLLVGTLPASSLSAKLNCAASLHSWKQPTLAGREVCLS